MCEGTHRLRGSVTASTRSLITVSSGSLLRPCCVPFALERNSGEHNFLAKPGIFKIKWAVIPSGPSDSDPETLRRVRLRVTLPCEIDFGAVAPIVPHGEGPSSAPSPSSHTGWLCRIDREARLRSAPGNVKEALQRANLAVGDLTSRASIADSQIQGLHAEIMQKDFQIFGFAGSGCGRDDDAPPHPEGPVQAEVQAEVEALTPDQLKDKLKKTADALEFCGWVSSGRVGSGADSEENRASYS
ncbi:hypothetical protein R1sor_021174 [Riccia sorocarpa]|uniref:Uncharacterized protein n=1 Tax=Riccia sorocarpa TaxID=122646 RepID=A0ABD3GH19_9MARC